MLQDILAHRRTEIDSINGAIVRAARERNIPVPYTEMLWTLVSLIDARLGAPNNSSSQQAAPSEPLAAAMS
jgi:2-dehydropantoate 2-reductase